MSLLLFCGSLSYLIRKRVLKSFIQKKSENKKLSPLPLPDERHSKTDKRENDDQFYLLKIIIYVIIISRGYLKTTEKEAGNGQRSSVR